MDDLAKFNETADAIAKAIDQSAALINSQAEELEKLREFARDVVASYHSWAGPMLVKHGLIVMDEGDYTLTKLFTGEA